MDGVGLIIVPETEWKKFKSWTVQRVLLVYIVSLKRISMDGVRLVAVPSKKWKQFRSWINDGTLQYYQVNLEEIMILLVTSTIHLCEHIL